MRSGRCINGFGILRHEGTNGDQSNFKGGLMPYMVNYINDTAMPADIREEAKRFMRYNAETLWLFNMDRSMYPAMYCNHEWDRFYTEQGNPGSCGAHNGGAALLEGMTRLK
jgi:predicted alpha-1,6-mannanase (GH76 family)